MKTAFLFPGQGSQFVGMGRDIYEAFPGARGRFQQANDMLGIPVTAVMFGEGKYAENAAEALRQTDVTQPALYLHSMAVMRIFSDAGMQFDMAAGHSLGEYSALAAAGAISFEDGLRIVRLRGSLMADVGTTRPGTMAAVLGMEDEQVAEICAAVSGQGKGVVQPANYNAPGQVVISGDVAAVEEAGRALAEKGARKVIPLPVSGAFHSPLMADAAAGLAEALESLPISKPTCPVYLNVDASPTTDPEVIRRRLLEQLTSPVRWSQSVLSMRDDGAEQFIEVGTGNVLAGLVKRILGRDARTATAGKADEIQSLIANA